MNTNCEQRQSSLCTSSRLRRRQLPAAIRAAAFAGVAAAVYGASAYGQTTSPTQPPNNASQQTLQTVIVTGSHIPAAEIATSNPVITITPQQIQATGKLSLGSIIQQLPVFTGGLTTPNMDFGGNGGVNLGLRGLGPSRTLVLIDGQRIQDGTVDLDTIPTAAVESIQVLTDGASAIYGSDAIGGVINIILKSKYQGGQLSLNTGISDHGDGQRRGASFMFGQTTDRGSIMAVLSATKFDAVPGAARDFSRDTLSLSTTSGGMKKLIPGPQGLVGKAPLVSVTVPQSLASKFGCTANQTLALKASAWHAGTSPTTSADYRCFEPTDNFNYYNTLNLVTPQRRANLYLRGSLKISDRINAFVTYLHTTNHWYTVDNPPQFGTSSDTSSAPGVVISKDSYYNPFGVDFSNASGNLFSVTLPGPGLLRDESDSTFDYLNAGLRGRFELLSQDWTWDLGVNFSHNKNVATATDLFSYETLEAGTGPSFLNASGVVQCGSPSAPIPLTQCTPWDPFNTNTASSRAAFASPVSAVSDSIAIQRGYYADVTGGVFQLPGGTVQLALGADYRSEYVDGSEAPGLLLNSSTGTCLLSGSCGGPALNAGYNVKEVYGELFVPIVKDMPFAHEVDVTLGDRYSRYSDFGSTNNWKIGLSYRPVSDLLFRGTVSSVFRAPTMADELGSPSVAGFLLNADPCDFVAPTPDSANPNAGSPACVGVPARGTFINNAVKNPNFAAVEGFIGGAEPLGFSLGPETGKSFDFGAIFSPSFVPGLSLTTDIWRIYLNNVLTRVSAQTELNLCFQGDAFLCPLIKRFQSGTSQGQVETISTPVLNLGRLDVKGVDFGATYRVPFTKFGHFNLGLNATYLTQYKSQTAPGTPTDVTANGAGLMATVGSAISAACPQASAGLCYLPRIRAQGTVGWNLNDWSAQWTVRLLGKFGIPGDTGTQIGVDRYGATVYNDVTVGYDIVPMHTRFSFGIDNLFDRQPPALYNRTFEFNTDTNDFDVLGRYYWARATVTFD